jgi:type IV secretion system protein VirB10
MSQIISPVSPSIGSKTPRNLLIVLVVTFTAGAMFYLFAATPDAAPDNKKPAPSIEQKKAEAASSPAGNASTIDQERQQVQQRLKQDGELRSSQESDQSLRNPRNSQPPGIGMQGRSIDNGPLPAPLMEDSDARAAQASRENDARTGTLLLSDATAAPESVANTANPADSILKALQEPRIAPAGGNLDAITAALAKVGGQGAQLAPQQNKDFLKEFNSTQPENKGSTTPYKIQGRFVLLRQTSIPAVACKPIDTQLPGSLCAMVTNDIYDSLTGNHLVIPKGSRLTGNYNDQVRYGQSRILGGFDRIVLPDGTAFDLAGARLGDATGAAGLPGEIDDQYLRLFGIPLMIGLLTDSMTRNSSQSGSVSAGNQQQLSATGQIMVDTTRSELDRARAVTRIIRVKGGVPLTIETVSDLAFPKAWTW